MKDRLRELDAIRRKLEEAGYASSLAYSGTVEEAVERLIKDSNIWRERAEEAEEELRKEKEPKKEGREFTLEGVVDVLNNMQRDLAVSTRIVKHLVGTLDQGEDLFESLLDKATEELGYNTPKKKRYLQHKRRVQPVPYSGGELTPEWMLNLEAGNVYRLYGQKGLLWGALVYVLPKALTCQIKGKQVKASVMVVRDSVGPQDDVVTTHSCCPETGVEVPHRLLATAPIIEGVTLSGKAELGQYRPELAAHRADSSPSAKVIRLAATAPAPGEIWRARGDAKTPPDYCARECEVEEVHWEVYDAHVMYRMTEEGVASYPKSLRKRMAKCRTVSLSSFRRRFYPDKTRNLLGTMGWWYIEPSS